MVTRIRQLLDTKQLTPTQFADLIGVGRPVMSHILSERNKPSLEVVQRIINAFPEVSVHWLLSGLGEMLEEATVADPLTPPATTESQPAPPPPASTAVPAEEPAAANNPIEPTTEESQPTPVAAATVASLAPPTFAASALEAALAAQAVSAAPQPLVVAPQAQALPIIGAPGTVPTPAPGAAAAPTVRQSFRAARFVPAASTPVAASRKLASPALPARETSAVVPPAAPVPALPAAGLPAPGPSTVSTVSRPSPEAALLPFLGEPGKEIKRIVIFYRDGSFANYQPEA